MQGEDRYDSSREGMSAINPAQNRWKKDYLGALRRVIEEFGTGGSRFNYAVRALFDAAQDWGHQNGLEQASEQACKHLHSGPALLACIQCYREENAETTDDEGETVPEKAEDASDSVKDDVKRILGDIIP